MILVPSVDLEDGVAVKRVRGVPGTGLVLGDPQALLKRLYRAGFRKVHIVDLQGPLLGEPTRRALQVVKYASYIGFKVRFGGGIRSLGHARAACESGASEIVLGTLWLARPEEAGIIASMRGLCTAYAAVEVDGGGYLLMRGWRDKSGKKLEEAVHLVRRLGFHGVLYTRVYAEGTASGVEEVEAARVRSLTRGLRLAYSGGIASLRDLELLSSLGVDEVVVGAALYTGLIPWEVATRYA